MKILWFSFVFIAVWDFSLGMTRVQLKKTMTVMKNSCKPKIGVTEDQIGKIEQGVFLENHDVMCYISCIYKMVNVIKDGRLVKESVLKQVDILYPPEIRAGTKKAIEKCFGIQDKYEDPCEGVFHAVKCLYEDDPTNFIFP